MFDLSTSYVFLKNILTCNFILIYVMLSKGQSAPPGYEQDQTGFKSPVIFQSDFLPMSPPSRLSTWQLLLLQDCHTGYPVLSTEQEQLVDAPTLSTRLLFHELNKITHINSMVINQKISLSFLFPSCLILIVLEIFYHLIIMLSLLFSI